MDPFTTILRALIGKKAIEGASNVANNIYKDNKETIDDVAQGFSTAAQMTAKEALPALAASTLLPGGIGTGLVIQGYLKNKKEKDALRKAANRSDYESIVKIAQDAGYTPSDAEVDTLLQSIKNRNIVTTAGDATKEANIDTPLSTEPKEAEEEGDVIEYTYKPGDTFGQVLLNLGLSDGSNLWGQGGDVEFYTQQLRNQNMLDSRGNVKLGIPFKLRRRK